LAFFDYDFSRRLGFEPDLKRHKLNRNNNLSNSHPKFVQNRDNANKILKMGKMNLPDKRLFPASIEEAFTIQKELAQKVMTVDGFSTLKIVGGMDVSCQPRDPKKMIYASFVRIAFQTQKLIDTTSSAMTQAFPYIPGLLGFREAPALVQAYHECGKEADIIFVDGHGISHPRGLGIASHIGILLNISTIGVAKNILVGKPDGKLGNEVGDWVPLVWKDKEIGRVVRTKRGVNPVIVSIGHMVSLESAQKIVLCLVKKYRLPEPIRQAHIYANIARKEQSLDTKTFTSPT
jgi:deoxyribonuclease V